MIKEAQWRRGGEYTQQRFATKIHHLNLNRIEGEREIDSNIEKLVQQSTYHKGFHLLLQFYSIEEEEGWGGEG